MSLKHWVKMHQAARRMRAIVSEYRDGYTDQEDMLTSLWLNADDLGIALANQRHSSTPFSAFG